MPYKSSKIKLPEKFDRRVKLTRRQKELIYHAFHNYTYTQNFLAKAFGVHRSSIRFIINPEALERSKQIQKENKRWLYNKNKEGWAKTMREHRRYKQDLYLDGKIVE